MGIFDELWDSRNDEPISDAAIQPFINSIQVSKERLFIKTVLYSGVNPSSLSDLRWSDIDFRAGSILLYNRRKKRMYAAYLPSKLIQEYKQLKLENGQLVFGYSEYLLKNMLDNWTKQFFGKPKTWHAIRLTYLLNARKAGERFEVVATNMGVNPDALLKYWSPSPTDMRRSAELIR